MTAAERKRAQRERERGRREDALSVAAHRRRGRGLAHQPFVVYTTKFSKSLKCPSGILACIVSCVGSGRSCISGFVRARLPNDTSQRGRY